MKPKSLSTEVEDLQEKVDQLHALNMALFALEVCHSRYWQYAGAPIAETEALLNLSTDLWEKTQEQIGELYGHIRALHGHGDNDKEKQEEDSGLVRTPR